MNENHFNIVVIGSGVVGLAIAERLSRDFSDILVVPDAAGCKVKFSPESIPSSSGVVVSLP